MPETTPGTEQPTIFFEYKDQLGEGVYSSVFNSNEEVLREWLKHPGAHLFTTDSKGELIKVEKRVLRIVTGLGTASRWETIDVTVLFKPEILNFDLNEQSAIPDTNDPILNDPNHEGSARPGGVQDPIVQRIAGMFPYMEMESIDR